MFEISCSIVLYNNPSDEVRKAVESFLKYPGKIKLYLIDNSPEDHLRYQFISPNIEYIFNGRNLGYGAGHNIAIKKARRHSLYHLILNPDVEFNPSILVGLYNFMEQNKSVGLVMPKVLYRNGDTQYLCKRLPSPADLFLRRFVPGKLKFMLKKFLDGYELRHKNYNELMAVPNLSGCFMFIRSEIFASVGLFDEQYFMYLEDTDLSRRINRYYQTVYYPLETIIHGYRKASYKNLKLTKHHLVSSVKYFNKWGWFKDHSRSFINRTIDADALRYNLQNHNPFLQTKTNNQLTGSLL